MSGFAAGSHAPLCHDRRRSAWRMPSNWLRALARAAEVRASRRQLALMDQRMLADIGISRAEAVEEANRAIWDVAPHPRQQF